MSTYITVAIPYVNAAPHLGYAYELIDADLAVRARRARGEPVRFLGGTDDHSLKNVLAADAAGVSTRAFVDRHADRFEALAKPLGVTFDDFIRTSRDPRHRPAVERLWRACHDAGDLYLREYVGRYCVGCEQFYDVDALVDGCCAEHGTPAETVSETNWFFRLSRYQDRLLAAIEDDELRIEPAQYRNEVLAFLRADVEDISVSRSIERARGWGIPVPDDPGQVIAVWFDALTNYVSALGYGTDGPHFREWWTGSQERIHVIGKGILRFHAVSWPAFLLSAGEPLPTLIHVHPYLTADGAKLSKSSGSPVSPTDLVAAYGADALRWWCARDVSATADTDFTVQRLIDVADRYLANGLGNTTSRIAALVVKHRDGRTPAVAGDALPAANALGCSVVNALADFDRRSATDEVVAALDELNRYLESTVPWQLARDPDRGDQFDLVIGTAVATLRAIAHAVEPITPDTATAVLQRLDPGAQIGSAEPVVPRRADQRPIHNQRRPPNQLAER